LDPRGTGLVFGLRFVAMALGIFFGEGWMPIAITGGVATGKSTVSLQLFEGKEVGDIPAQQQALYQQWRKAFLEMSKSREQYKPLE
jgi:hypothetical protein